MTGLFKRACVTVMSVCLLQFSLPLTAQAGVIGTATVLEQQSRDVHLANVQSQLDRSDVADRLESLGVDRAELDARLAALTDAELAQLSVDLESAPAGGILGVIGIVFVVLLILEYTGAIDIFKKIP